jgi:hypothetical protein
MKVCSSDDEKEDDDEEQKESSTYICTLLCTQSTFLSQGCLTFRLLWSQAYDDELVAAVVVAVGEVVVGGALFVAVV